MIGFAPETENTTCPEKFDSNEYSTTQKIQLCAIKTGQINSLSARHFSCITTSLKMTIMLNFNPPPTPQYNVGKRTNFPSGTAPSTRPEAQHCNGGAGGCENILLKKSYDNFVANCRPVLVTFFISKKTEQKNINCLFFQSAKTICVSLWENNTFNCSSHKHCSSTSNSCQISDKKRSPTLVLPHLTRQIHMSFSTPMKHFIWKRVIWKMLIWKII